MVAAAQAAAATPVDTKHVQGRRQVRFETYDDVRAEAERLAAIEVRTLGNWSYPQILDHLTKAIHGMIDGAGFQFSLPMRLMFGLLMKRKMLTQTLPSGFQFPSSVAAQYGPPADAEVGAALEAFRGAIDRAKNCPTRAPHPAFGKIGRAEWDAFQLRHCEMHLSFVVPVTG